MSSWQPALGAIVHGDATRFRVWAPGAECVEVMLETPGQEVNGLALTHGPDGFHQASVPSVTAGDLHPYWSDGRGPFPDPASRFQPQGVHGPSQVVDWRHFPWTDEEWPGVPLEGAVFHELDVGAFTPEGDVAAAAMQLSYLKDLGVTAVELMPLAHLPGRWNWGYDGAAPFPPARCYGSPDELRGLVDQAHSLGLAVYRDVVYNHIGADGAYQSAAVIFWSRCAVVEEE